MTIDEKLDTLISLVENNTERLDNIEKEVIGIKLTLENETIRISNDIKQSKNCKMSMKIT